jgi:hypothetical protein
MYDHMYYDQEDIMLPVERLKMSWNNLQSIKSLHYSCDEKALKLIQENFPNIESVFLFYFESLANSFF